MKIEPFTLGMGDRFGRQGASQLSAIVQANAEGIAVFPVWNKSNREHTIIGTEPGSLRAEADLAVRQLGWRQRYYVDADHIGQATVDRFVEPSNFFTLDVADFIGQAASAEALADFARRRSSLVGAVVIEGIACPLEITAGQLRSVAEKFLLSIQEAGRIYRHLEASKGGGNFVVEVSIDETDEPQSPVELLLILAMIADEGIPAQTVAPKFSGRFNKGVDYVGNLGQFEREFDEDLCVVAHAVREFGLSDTLKLSVHSGSDKFSLYPILRQALRRHRCGLHVKTAGTTWLEEVAGLAESGGGALEIAKEIYLEARPHFDALVKPYAAVVDIDPARLPPAEAVKHWRPDDFVAALRHDASCAGYNADFRQFMHVSFKIAAKMGARFTEALEAHADIVGRNVAHNLLERHIRPIFGVSSN